MNWKRIANRYLEDISQLSGHKNQTETQDTEADGKEFGYVGSSDIVHSLATKRSNEIFQTNGSQRVEAAWNRTTQEPKKKKKGLSIYQITCNLIEYGIIPIFT